MGIENLPKTKWLDADEQVILKEDFIDIEEAILDVSAGALKAPQLTWIDATAVRVLATADSPAQVVMSGFPNFLHPGRFITAGICDNTTKIITSAVTMDFDVSSTFLGTEKVSQWYMVCAQGGVADFTLLSVPICRVKSQAVQTISLGTNITPATGIGYGLDTDALENGAIYFFSGASVGLLRTITANNDDDGTGGTITYSGDALSVAAGDWFVIFPPDVNFRWLMNIWNTDAAHIGSFRNRGNAHYWTEDLNAARTLSNISGIDQENVPWVDPMAYKLYLSLYDTGDCELIVSGPDQADQAGWDLYLYQYTTGLPVGAGVQRGSSWTFIEICKATFASAGGPTISATANEYPPGFR